MTVDTTADSGSPTQTEPASVEGEADLQAVVAANDVVLADFYADWCGPCQMLDPVVERLANETAAAVVKIDVDANQAPASAYGVRGVPTLVLFADGEQVEEVVGVHGEDRLRDLIKQYTGE